MRHKLIPACYLIIIKEDKVLMLERANTGYKDGYLSLPAGHVEHKEDVKHALIREVKEEINIDLQTEDIQEKIILHRYNDPHNFEYIDFFFTANKWSGEIKNNEPEKCSQLIWANLNSLKEYKIIPYIKFVLENLDDNLKFLEIEN